MKLFNQIVCLMCSSLVLTVAHAAKFPQAVELDSTCLRSADCAKVQIGFTSTDVFDGNHFAQTNDFAISHTYTRGPKNIKLVFYRIDRNIHIILDPSCHKVTRTPERAGTLSIHVDYGSQEGQFLVSSRIGKYYRDAIPVKCRYQFTEATDDGI